MSVRPEVSAANAEYAENFGSKGSLALPPARQFAMPVAVQATMPFAHSLFLTSFLELPNGLLFITPTAEWSSLQMK